MRQRILIVDKFGATRAWLQMGDKLAVKNAGVFVRRSVRLNKLIIVDRGGLDWLVECSDSYPLLLVDYFLEVA